MSTRSAEMLRVGLLVLGSGLALMSLGTVAWSNERHSTVSLDIQPQTLGTALNAFAQQSGLRVIFFSDLGKGVLAPRVTGRLTPEVALGQLLAGSSLSYEFVDEKTVAIRRVKGDASDPLAHAADASGTRVSQ